MVYVTVTGSATLGFFSLSNASWQYLDNELDVVSDPIYIPYGFPFGDEIHTKAYVSSVHKYTLTKGILVPYILHHKISESQVMFCLMINMPVESTEQSFQNHITVYKHSSIVFSVVLSPKFNNNLSQNYNI